MSNRQLTQDFQPYPSDYDAMNHIKPASLFTIMQNAAILHADLLGSGRAALLPKGVVWVLSRVVYQLPAAPIMGEPLRVTTWPGAIQKYLFPRYFTFEDGKGQSLGAAASYWLLIHEATREIALPKQLGIEMPDTSLFPGPIALPGKLPVPPDQGERTAHTRQARYSDIDVNLHMNNARYVEWFMDALPTEALAHKRFATLQMNYLSEILPGRDIGLECVVADQEAWVYGTAADGKRCFEGYGQLASAESNRYPSFGEALGRGHD